MDSTVLRYRNLDESQRNEFLDRLLDTDGSIPQLLHLNKRVTELLRLGDFVRLLPSELSELILMYLDAASLLQCCQVSLRWNGYISQLDRVWEKECVRLGMDMKMIDVTRRRMNGSAVTKRIYQRRAKLMNRMKMGTAFCRTDLRFHEKRVNVVWYFNGKVYAGCSDEMISIWDANSCHLLRTIKVNFCPTSIKSDFNVLLASSTAGTLASWKEKELCNLEMVPNRLNYERHAGSVFSFDFDTKLDLLVSVSSDMTVKLWCLSSTRLLLTLHGHDKWILRVLFVSKSECFTKCRILTMQCNALFLWQYDPSTTSCKHEARFPIINKINAFYTPGLKLHPHSVSFVQQGDIDRSQILTFDIIKNAICSTLNFNFKVKKLLSLGDRYICFALPQNEDPNLIVVDFISKKFVAKLNIPRTIQLTPNLEQICLCDERWLDGFGLDIDGLPLAAVGCENGDICLFKWVSKEIKD